MSELVRVEDSGLIESGDRRLALEGLAQEAEGADGRRAHEIMLQGKAIASLLAQVQAPYEEAWLAGKASIVAARRLGKLLAQTSNERQVIQGNGSTRSERRHMVEALGVKRRVSRRLVSLAAVPDADFQRYIQDRSVIPCLGGYGLLARSEPVGGSLKRRKRKVVARPSSPSLDEGYSLIVRALGHLSADTDGNAKRRTAITAAIALLHEAEDLLKPHRGGYTK